MILKIISDDDGEMIKKNFTVKTPFVKQDIENAEKKMNQNNKFDLKILLAEDDIINQKIYILGFSKFFNNIDVAANGEEVLSMLDNNNYSAIIMDLQMPKLNGIETVEKIRLNERQNKHVPIIAITANTIIYNKQDILRFGFDDYFIKPFRIKDVYSKITEIINSQKSI